MLQFVAVCCNLGNCNICEAASQAGRGGNVAMLQFFLVKSYESLYFLHFLHFLQSILKAAK